MPLKSSLFVVPLLLLSQLLPAQDSVRLTPAAGIYLKIASVKAEHAKVLEQFPYRQSQPTISEARQELGRLLSSLHDAGYLLADTLLPKISQDTVRVGIWVGEQFKWTRLEAGNVNPGWLQRTAWRQKSYTQKPFRYQELRRLMRSLVRQAENAGHPFASLQLDSIRIDSLQQLQARLHLEEGPYIKFDTIKVQGASPLTTSFLGAHTGIRPNRPYRQQEVEAVAARLRDLPYIRVLQEPVVTFQNEQATVHLELAPKKANMLDGVIGLMPDPQNTGRLLFTGQLDLRLMNPFRTGKQLELHWQRLNENSQNLEASYYHPYLLRTPLSIELGFALLKEEERFVNREFRIGTEMRQGASNTIRLLFLQKDSRLLQEANELGYAGFKMEQFGLGFKRNRVDNTALPRRGYTIELQFSGGNKRIQNLSSVADSLREQSMHYRAQGYFSYYQPLGENIVWAHRIAFAGMADEQLFVNDMYRLGGLNSLRGFAEKNYFTSRYLLSRGELRYMAGGESFLFLFYDQAWLRQMQRNLHVTDWPLGLGAGLSLGTNAGTFNFVYGVGKSQTQPLSFVNSQIHFGYISRF